MITFSTIPAERRPARERERLLADPVFGQVFTDHMVTVKWSSGWHDARLEPYGPLALEPSAQVFHYGQEIFEGMKAFRRADGSIVTFRPRANAERLNRSAARMAMPELPVDVFMQAVDLLVGADRDWVPHGEGRSLYLRPFMIATQPSLGLHGPSNAYLFVLIASPVGSYFGGKPVSVWVSTEHCRAAPGGTGAAKCGGNYAGTILVQQQAREHGCDQVVWLDPVERRWIEEMGTSNMFFVYGSKLVTPRLTGTLLAGVTRDSLLTLAADLGHPAAEEGVSVEQWRKDAESGALTETFSCGTSSMITPVDRAVGVDGEFRIPAPGPVTVRLREELQGIQAGTRPDRHGWMHEITCAR
ncbi:branched-chain amino acid aminotransferase [Kutzneria buriramensis]|uniref:Branched-chain-amino-acid aminotransferase n=1 Tax=Kutzneria buriramensis TaxID=1045776 RepID=A0A3E0HFB7_9PSEU|nr:branched-chain amino acid aminotransferase [Kutzneria buriramensis]REH43495.1 branched-chain amino acid aminotransferase [Kutzneria buriramensis]